MCDASIALLYAMPKEIDSLLRESPGASLIMTVAGVNFYIISGDIIAVTGGIGKVNAAMAAQLVIERFHVSTIINVGVAGCFQNVDIGTLILADKFVQHDVDTSGCGDPVGLVSTVNTVEFPTAQNGLTTRSTPSLSRWKAPPSHRSASATMSLSSRSNPSQTVSSATTSTISTFQRPWKTSTPSP